MRAPDEHTKLARVAISFSPSLDEAFKINVAKMRVQIPESVREDLGVLVKNVINQARRVYDRKEKKASATQGTRVSENGASSVRDDSVAGRGGSGFVSRTHAQPAGNETHGISARSKSEELLTFRDWSRLTISAASGRERPYVKSVLKKLEQTRV
jgi:hypothetical protein